ncbi:protein-disulfide reductase DsbD domain-containing protein [uncultured Tateyamaria sp.]|uniref:protein-disulfide reductase DsbD domain-containing protein n=1 Tax=uncultured Tateyamaria sp. TaxID=455651 RepID=UPI00260E9FB5|nr:protein-disulfide reductase DsbD domain-containing protein [uncultured Tateyamaria sp.]
MTVRFSFLAAGAICAAASSAHAQSGFDDVVQAEVLQGWDLPDGRRVAALRLTLAPGWKTYWRAPGDAGIPPHFDWGRARNLQNVSVTWPTPNVYVEYGLRSIGYTGQVVIPVYVTPARAGKPVRLRSTMSLGVCAEVCLPHQIEFDTLLDAPDASPTPAIVAALADVPYSASEAGVSAATCTLRPTDRGMQIEARVTLPDTGGREVAVIEPGVPGVWVSEAKTTRRGGTVTAVSEMVHQKGGAFGVDRSNVRITILGGDYAVDIKGCTGS